ncbi:MAG: DUF6544 family protein [Litorimonas sp.]
MKVIVSFIVFIVLLSIGLTILKNYDDLLGQLAWRKLEKVDTPLPEQSFSIDMVSDLPQPARRYFEYMITPGTPLKSSTTIEMGGRLGLGPKDRPDYMDMGAVQILTFPEGFVWKMKSGRGPMVLTGFDGLYKDKSWSRFWLMQSIPVGRAGGRSHRQADHRRSAFGRLAMETAMWAPGALLPSEIVSWTASDSDTAVATIKYDGLVQVVEIHVDDNGQPLKIETQRWSDVNPSNSYRPQPFGGFPSAFKEFNGYRLPTHVEGGHLIGTKDYFPFYIADIEKVTFGD